MIVAMFHYHCILKHLNYRLLIVGVIVWFDSFVGPFLNPFIVYFSTKCSHRVFKR